MITLDGKPVTALPETEGYVPDTLQRGLFKTMLDSSHTYKFQSVKHLTAELRIRGSVVTAARDLAHSGIRFKVFRDSTTNTDYWRRTPEGGFTLRSDVLPSDAIRDIYQHGQKYGTECATAMIIVLYKAMLDVMPEDQFNRLYSDIYLMNWKHVDRDLAIIMLDEAADELPGDAGYFVNPDVDPLRPEWQGENVYYLGDGRYYGHGVGVRDADNLIRSLNAHRREGSQKAAYQSPSVKRQDYLYLSSFLNG